MKKTSRTLLLLYILLGYVITQFLWWGYSIYGLNRDITIAQIEIQELKGESHEVLEDVLSRKLYMVIGEGSVFFFLLLLGAFFLSRFILKSEQVRRRERNFLMATTHEFNSPIAAMKLNLQTMLKRDLTPEQLKQVANSALHANYRLENLVSNVLVASRLDTGKLDLLREEVDLTQLIIPLVGQFEPIAAQSKNKIEVDIIPGLKANIDSSATQTIVSNLLENALKYAPETPILIKAFSESEYLVIEVSDQGLGIPSAERSQIVEKFYRIQNEETRTQKGTGLGLYIVAQLVLKHDGKLTIEDNLPNGTKFIAKLKLK